VAHGNTGVGIFGREKNSVRDRASALKVGRLSPKAFKRRFKINKCSFSDLVRQIRPLVEPDEYGRAMAERFSGSHSPAELQLAASLRWLAGANYLCQEDNLEVGTASFRCMWRVVNALYAVLPAPYFDPADEAELQASAHSLFVRSGETMAACMGAVDGMVVRIHRP